MKPIILYSFLIYTSLTFLNGQNQKPFNDGFGMAGSITKPCIYPKERSRIDHLVLKTVQKLKAKGKYLDIDQKTIVLLKWPLKQAPGFNYNSYYRITNYVDQDLDAPDQLLDWNCGMRTYDLENGYNHDGIDIALYPFSWNMMAADQVQVVAAASGMIVYKEGDQFDMNCEIAGGVSWNAIYIDHSDGSRTKYGHLKKNSLTSKGEGDMVSAGEFLGHVGSSGSSTGPHIHFEVTDADGNLIEPFSGPCNSFNNSSWWQNQKPYREPTINVILTHSAKVDSFDCPNQFDLNLSNQFEWGDDIVYAIYLHDQLDGTNLNMKVYDADNNVQQNFFRSFTKTYSSSYYFYTRDIDCGDVEGTWRVEGNYEGETVTHYFNVGDCPFNKFVNQTVLAGKTKGYRAENAIIAENEIQQNTCVTLAAGDHVALTHGFHAKSGSEVDIFIKDCSGQFNLTSNQETDFYLSQNQHSETNVIDRVKDGEESKAFKIFPNPFYNKTTIEVSLEEGERVLLKVFDLNGRLVKKIFETDHVRTSLRHQFELDLSGQSAGIYTCILILNDQVLTNKLYLLN